MALSTLKIAWRNLGRNRKRTALALLAIAAGQLTFLVTTAVMRGYGDRIQDAITGPMLGDVQVHHPDWRQERAPDLLVTGTGRLLAEIRRDPLVLDAAARVQAPVLAAPEERAFTATVFGVEVEREAAPHGILAGLEEPLAPGQVLVGHLLARRMGIRPGARLALVGQDVDGAIACDIYTVQDVIRCPAAPVNEGGIVMSLADARELLRLGDEAHEIVVWGRHAGLSEALARRIAALPGLAGLEVKTWKELAPELVQLLGMVDVSGYIMLFFVLVAAAAGIANTMLMATFERTHEFGMILALGGRPGRLVRMIVAEAAVLGLLGAVVGTLLGWVFVAVTARTGLDMAAMGGEAARDFSYRGLNLPLLVYPRLAGWDPLPGLAAVLSTALLAAAWPAALVARMEPVEAMRS